MVQSRECFVEVCHQLRLLFYLAQVPICVGFDEAKCVGLLGSDIHLSVSRIGAAKQDVVLDTRVE